ncbi:MAG: hypothetical protein A2096_09180 [Spirochaetes bacterium GWF1_41_5]|nr:MAG: hypothetical protein A2096_09180 [Spirochaetes bacterium GWF1_41_5]HBE03104.1 hypothetical protein [Spirochaetia bacterium]
MKNNYSPAKFPRLRRVFFTAVPLLLALLWCDPKGDEIMKKHFALKKSEDALSTASMILIDKTGARKTRKIISYSQETGEGKNTFIEFLEPADVKGTRFLTIAHKNIDDEQRLYLPALKKVRKIAASGKDGKFMGTDLYFYDMEDRNFEDQNYTYIKDGTFEQKPCFIVEAVSKDPNAPYGKSLEWVSRDDYFIYKIEAYDKKSLSLVKTIVFLEIKNINGVLIAHKTAVDNHKDIHKTLISLDEVRINSGISEKIFTVQNLEK